MSPCTARTASRARDDPMALPLAHGRLRRPVAAASSRPAAAKSASSATRVTVPQAAADLAAGGMTVTVLEARDRLGGRVWTLKDSKGKPIEMGAQWIHGTNNPLP
jgi:hypothetical protein